MIYGQKPKKIADRQGESKEKEKIDRESTKEKGEIDRTQRKRIDRQRECE